jgi:uncharacterized coiled-coil DUF342 family protein
MSFLNNLKEKATQLKEKAAEFKEKATPYYEQFKEKAADKAAEFKEKATPMLVEALEKTTNKLNDLKSKLSENHDSVKEIPADVVVTDETAVKACSGYVEVAEENVAHHDFPQIQEEVVVLGDYQYVNETVTQ